MHGIVDSLYFLSHCREKAEHDRQRNGNHFRYVQFVHAGDKFAGRRCCQDIHAHQRTRHDSCHHAVQNVQQGVAHTAEIGVKEIPENLRADINSGSQQKRAKIRRCQKKKQRKRRKNKEKGQHIFSACASPQKCGERYEKKQFCSGVKKTFCTVSSRQHYTIPAFTKCFFMIFKPSQPPMRPNTTQQTIRTGAIQSWKRFLAVVMNSSP